MDDLTDSKVPPLTRQEYSEIARRRQAARESTDAEASPDNSVASLSDSRYLESEKPTTHDVEGDHPSEDVLQRNGPNMVKSDVNLSEQLREAIEKSGLTRNQIARQTGVSYSLIHGFMARTKDLQLNTASRIAAIIGLGFSGSGEPPRAAGSTRTKRSGAARNPKGPRKRSS